MSRLCAVRRCDVFTPAFLALDARLLLAGSLWVYCYLDEAQRSALTAARIPWEVVP